MNNAFREYATSTAFALQLSKLQCHTLLWEYGRKRRTIKYDNTIGDIPTYRALEARGLIAWTPRPKPPALLGITKEGELVAQLLIAAGLTLENTVTPKVHQHRQYWGVKAANE